MKLSELLHLVPSSISLTLERDGEFSLLGYATHPINTKALLVFAGSEKFVDAVVKNPLATCVITTKELAGYFPPHFGVILCSDPLTTFYDIHHLLMDETDFYGKSFDTIIDKGAIISPHAIIAEKNVRIGSGVVIEAGAIVHEKATLKEGVVLHSKAVISSEGFEYKKLRGKMTLIRHSGGVTLGDGVQVHTGSMVDKGVFGEDTFVGAWSAMDNMVHLAHGVKTGESCLFAAGVVVAAAVLIGDNVRIDLNATIAHEIIIGNNVYVTMGAAVVDNIDEGMRVSGNFAVDHFKFYRNWLKSYR